MKRDIFRLILIVVGLVTIVGVFSACAPAAAPTPTPTQAPKPAAPAPTVAAPAPTPAPKTVGTEIKIGYINPFSGVLADFGPRNRIGVDMAVKEVNAAGGINGVPLKVLEGDSRSDEQEVIKLTQKFATDDKVLAILGFFESPGITVGFPHANRLKVPAITQSPPMPGVLKENQPWGVTFNLPDSAMIPVALKEYVKAYNVKKLASIYATDQGYLKGLGEQLVAGAKAAGLEALDPIFIGLGDTDFTATVTRLKAQNADGVAITTSAIRAGPMIVEMRRQGVKIPAVGSTVLAESSLIATGGEAVEGTISGAAYWQENPDPIQVKFAGAFEARAKVETPKSFRSDAFVSIHYDIIRALAKIMKDGGITNKPEDLAKDREIIMKGLHALKDFPGVGGKLTMGPEGQMIREVFVVIAKGGSFQKLTSCFPGSC